MSGAVSDGDSTELLPLTPAQRGMWFAENLSADYSVNIAQYLDIRHAPHGIDFNLFVQICEEVGKEMESAYVRLTEVDGVPMQYVDVEFDQHSQIMDLRGHSDPVGQALAWMNAEYRRPVNLLDDQFVVLVLLRVADDRTFWYMRAHHIVVDGYAALVIMRRIVDRYNAAVRGDTSVVDKPPATMAEIIDYESSYLDSTRRAKDRDHWLSRVRDMPERVTLSHVAENAPLSFDHWVAGTALDPRLQTRIESVARECGSSMAVVLTAAFGAFLGRMTGVDDIVVSLPVTGRATAKIKRSGGMVSNILPIRLRDPLGKTVRELIDATQLEMTGALRHQRYRSEDIKRDAGVDGGTYGFGPRINMVFFDEPIVLEGAQVEYRILTSGILEDLLVNMYQASPGAPLVVDLHGNPHLYSRDEIDLHHRRFLSFVERMLADLSAGITDIDLLVPGEQDALAALQSGPPTEWTDVQWSEHNLIDRFAAHAAAHPDRVAVSDGAREWTYGQFDALRLMLADRLRGEGVTAGGTVAVQLDRGAEQVAAIYAILTVGAAYVPIDPSSPQSRRELVLSTARPSTVIDRGFLERSGLPMDPREVPEPDPATRTAARGRVAYVIFTSGSTGVPKGVQVSLAAVANRLAWMQTHYPITTGDAVLYKTPFTFDVSVWELFWPLQVGARMVIARPEGHRDPGYLRKLITEQRVTNVHFVPSMLDVFVDAVPAGTPTLPPSVQRVFTSGEALSASLAHRVVGETAAELINMYGPTEAAVEVTEYRVEFGEHTIPIGGPVPNVRTYVLDDQLRQVPVGVAGELYLAGTQLADGYVTQHALTAERFVADVIVPGERMYRTGDLVRWNAAGDLVFLGRTDFQVKIRGQRVELGEIEATLLSEESVEGAVVVVRTDSGPSAIVAYVRPRPGTGSADLPGHLLRWCRRHLPRYMVPSSVVVLDAFPVNSSGKLDRAALPAPELADEDTVEYVAPVTAREHDLVRVLSELLDVPQIGLRDNIFALGGDSLIAARLAARIRNDLGVAVTLNDIFESRDVGELAAVLDEAEASEGRRPLQAVSRPDRIPLSYPQTRVWFINRMDPSAATYNMPGAVRLGVSVDVAAMRAAVSDVVARHESLRTRFPVVDGEPVQQVLAPHEAATENLFVVQDVAKDDVAADLATTVADGFDVVAQLPVRFTLFAVRAPGGAVIDHVMVVVLHHIAGDGASLRPLIMDLLTAYSARVGGAAPDWSPLPVQYPDYAIWQRDVLGEESDPHSRLSQELAFWTGELAGAPELLALPLDKVRPHIPSGHGAFVDAVLDGDTVAAVRGAARRCEVTTFTFLHAALAAVLARVCDTDDVSIGTAVAGRDEPETADMIGMFVNTVVLRTHVSPADTVTELASRANRVRTRALMHSQVPFERVVDAVSDHRTLAHSPLFQVSFTVVPDHRAALQSANFEVLDARVPAAKYDLAVTAVEVPGEDGAADTIELEFAYATDLFDQVTIARIVRAFTLMVHGMSASPDTCLGSIDLLPPGELDLLTAPATGAEPGTFRDFILRASAAADPGSAAVTGATTVSNAVFDMRTNQLARELVSRGAGPGQVVAVAIDRSHLSILATVAVIKTGAAFVSIDPEYPPERRAAMLADSGALAGVTASHVGIADAGPAAPGHRLRRPDGFGWIVLDDSVTELRLAGHRGTPLADDELLRVPQLDDTAYLIYTSGSTGMPKATVVPNRGIANFVDITQKTFGARRRSRVLHVASTSFDAWITEFVMAFAVGAPLVIADRYTYAGEQLEEFIARYGVTHAVMTPSALATINPVQVPLLRSVVSCGEPCPPELLRRWAGTGREFVNAYGPTEMTVWVTSDGPLTENSEVTIGHPAPGVGALVLDTALRPTPVGVVGELYLTGDQVVLGYLHRAGLTSGRFVANPFDHGKRMYRSGDRVRRLADGRLLYNGRGDFQLKVRGMRIEPGEVDAVLNRFPGVAAALSVGVDGPTGETVLVSYVTPTDGASLFPDDIISFAAETLPSHMVPQSVLVLDEFELTPVGKIDRTKLPAADFTHLDDFVPPRTQLEGVIAEVFAQVLNVERVSVHSGFFELGGNSLSATRLVSRLSGVLGRPVPLKALFEAPSVAGIAHVVGNLATGQAVPNLVARQRAEIVPVTGVQRSMWLMNRVDPGNPAYNIAFALRLRGALDTDAVEAAAGDLIRRHEVLRTSYPMADGQPAQVIHPADEVLAELKLAPVDVDGDVRDAVAAVTGQGFDVTTRPAVRLMLLRVSADDHVMVFVIHHISADGFSVNPLGRDFMVAYSARAAGYAPAWNPLRIQYADFTLWQAERLAGRDELGVTEEQRQLRYWQDRLAGAPELISLPTDRPRPAEASFRGGQVPFIIEPDTVRALDEVAHRYNSTLFMVTQAAYAVLLGRLAGTTDVVVGTPYAGRGDSALEEVVGMFVNTLALRTRLVPSESFASLLERVRSEDLSDMTNSDVAFDEIVSGLDRPRTGAFNPVFQVMFAFQNLEFPAVSLPGLEISAVSEELVAAKVDLQLTLFPNDPKILSPAASSGAIRGEFLYATDIFDESTVQTHAERFVRILEQIVENPEIVVGDISISTEAEAEVTESAESPPSLPELVAVAAAAAPQAAAISTDAGEVAFAALAAMVTAMSATLPDADSALVTALMGLVPGLATAGPEKLGDVLDTLRHNASAAAATKLNSR